MPNLQDPNACTGSKVKSSHRSGCRFSPGLRRNLNHRLLVNLPPALPVGVHTFDHCLPDLSPEPLCGGFVLTNLSCSRCHRPFDAYPVFHGEVVCKTPSGLFDVTSAIVRAVGSDRISQLSGGVCINCGKIFCDDCMERLECAYKGEHGDCSFCLAGTLLIRTLVAKALKHQVQ